MSASERRHITRVKTTPCVLCKHIGVAAAPESDAHHIRTGQGMSQRSGDFLTIAMCKEHHQGNSGIHMLGRSGFEARYHITELDLLNDTLDQIYGSR
jgi:hypothetical protein